VCRCPDRLGPCDCRDSAHPQDRGRNDGSTGLGRTRSSRTRSIPTWRGRLLLGGFGLAQGFSEYSSREIMTKIETIIQTSKLEAVKNALHEIGVEGMTVLEVRGHGRQKGHTEFYRGREYTVDLIPKIKLETVLPEAMVEKAVQAIVTAARTGKIGDGKI